MNIDNEKIAKAIFFYHKNPLLVRLSTCCSDVAAGLTFIIFFLIKNVLPWPHHTLLLANLDNTKLGSSPSLLNERAQDGRWHHS